MNTNAGGLSVSEAANVAALREGLRAASHDIRQPVSAVLALVEAARLHPDTTPGVRSYLDKILQQALQISETARTVLDVESVRPPEPVPVQLDEVVTEALQPFRVTWSGRLCRHVAKGGLYVLGDAGLLRRSLVNVVENATRAAGPSGVVVVSVRAQQDHAVVEVADDGPGFGNIDGGTGIGLAQTRRILTSMRGHIGVESRSSLGGAQVSLTMPLLHEHDDAQEYEEVMREYDEVLTPQPRAV